MTKGSARHTRWLHLIHWRCTQQTGRLHRGGFTYQQRATSGGLKGPPAQLLDSVLILCQFLAASAGTLCSPESRRMRLRIRLKGHQPVPGALSAVSAPPVPGAPPACCCAAGVESAAAAGPAA